MISYTSVCSFLCLTHLVVDIAYAIPYNKLFDVDDARAEAERADFETAPICPNTLFPIDIFLDFSAKIKNEKLLEGAGLCSTNGLRRRQTGDYSCDASNPCSNVLTAVQGRAALSLVTADVKAIVTNPHLQALEEKFNPASSATMNRGLMTGLVANIPVGSISHLYFAFGFVTPGSFEVGPMDGNSPDLFSDLTALKSQNSGVKTVVSLGGWTFNDNGTSNQPVFGDMVSSSANRSKFITNLLSFLRNYAFDGVDFDWEYPGAPDRGGNPNDGINYTEFFKELQAAIANEPQNYIVSFTAPTSYWYLRHFDLKNMMQYVDFANVLSYDLHGTWDSTADNIGSVVLAHMNLTEIDMALDLFWRNGVDPNQLNLGLGFYGRSFQLADPSCWQPGCPFKGGAAPGAVSYDDQDTFQQKVEYANNVGLGGLLIWALDLDTDDLQALQAVIYPKLLNAYDKQTSDASYWQDATVGDCRVTDCGGSCVAGEVKITSQPCGSATPVFRHSSQADSLLCCLLSSAPDPSKCTWRGTAPLCNGHCQDNEVALESNKWGSGDYCEDGLKFYCCEIPDEKNLNCRETDCGGSCDPNTEDSLAGEFYDNCALQPKQLCCPKSTNFQNCAWHGQPGSCFDNHCDTGHQIQLAEIWDGGGSDCGIHLERDREFCCDPPPGQSPFLPVPLEYLFPDPPPASTADTEYKLSVDDTWGGKGTLGKDDPEDATFGFFVLTSPTTLQQSLDKRDGSHWELFDCFDSVGEEEHTIRMFCNDDTTTSNCDGIYLGHGVPGTILEMPSGCGPGRYAVAKELTIAKNQTLPFHITKRVASPMPIVYDLTFDYDFRRVPRDLGTTQLRLDYSNQEGYWDAIVDKAGDKKRKRSLEDFGGSHKKWLEEAWREDHKIGLVDRDELHVRWFGSDVLDWLKGLFAVAQGAPIIDHSISETVTVILLDEHFGLTLISTLAFPPDLSQSYLYFKNKGSVSAKFTLDALTSASVNTGDIELFGLENFGATFSVPGILTVGPNFRIFGSVDGVVTLSGYLESQVNLAQWDVQLAFPDASAGDNPTALSTPDRDGTQAIGQPTFNYSVAATGQLTAHVKPTVTFGLDFNQKFLPVSSAKVDLVADGYITFHASASTSNSGSSFCYGVDAGADLYASVEAPSAFGWDLSVPRYQIGAVNPKQIIPETCPLSTRDLDTSINSYFPSGYVDSVWNGTQYHGSLSADISKRDTIVVGPLLRLNSGLTCPGGDDTALASSCPVCDEESSDMQGLSPRQSDGSCTYVPPPPGEITCPAGITSRSIGGEELLTSEFHPLEKRTSKSIT
ncbi:MAG: hypothetical protein MMC33_005891 [Icmadophila ericetorum]|nr:hypothetical protein [Icmadophila ericetorum]